MKSVRLRKQGKFYCAYNEDAYVVNAIMNYKVSNGKIGFPINSLGKVTNNLDNSKVNYVVIDNDREIIKKQFSKNCYNKYLQLGMKNVNRMEENMLLIEKVKNLSDDKLTKISCSAIGAPNFII